MKNIEIEGKQVDIRSVVVLKCDDFDGNEDFSIMRAKFVDGTECDDLDLQALSEQIDYILPLITDDQYETINTDIE